MGPPGAGKGSQSARIREDFKIVSISTGQMFRDAYNNNEPIGIEAMKYIIDGNLVSDEITNEIVRIRRAYWFRCFGPRYYRTNVF